MQPNPTKRMSMFLFAVVLVSFGYSSEGEAGLSGDGLIDLLIFPSFTIRAGGNHPGVDRGFAVTDCNSSTQPPFENKCPNDATYVPSQFSGGYQAWSVGLAPSYDESTHIECDWEFTITWINGELVIGEQLVCLPVTERFLTGYLGNAVATVEWGEDVITTGSLSTHPTSVMAFHPNALPPCNGIILQVVAVCTNTVNSSYVQDAGYEMDLSFPDPACMPSLPGGLRSGSILDKNNGCFYMAPGTQISDLPASYQDTTALDPAGVFNVGFGSANAAGIVPGHRYLVQQFFSSTAPSDMIDFSIKVRHAGAITIRADITNAACAAGLNTDAFCFFGIDTASVGGGVAGEDWFDLITFPL